MITLRTLKAFLEERGPVFVIAKPFLVPRLVAEARGLGLPVVVALSEEDVPEGATRVFAEGLTEPLLVTMAKLVTSLSRGPASEVVVAVDPGETAYGIAVSASGVLLSTKVLRSARRVVETIAELRRALPRVPIVVKVGIASASSGLSLRLAREIADSIPGVRILLVEEARASRVKLGEEARRVRKHERSALKILLTPTRWCREVSGE